MKSTAAIFASIFSSAVAMPTKTPDLVMTSFTGSVCGAANIVAGTPAAIIAGNCMPNAAGSSTKVAAATTGTGYSLSSYAGTACAGTAAGAVTIPADATCTATSASPAPLTSATLMPFASAATKATDLTFGFYSDATCDTGVQAAALGTFGYLNGASGTCLALPGGATSAKIEYTSAMMDVSLYLSGTGAADCGVTGSSAPTGVVSGTPGMCKQLTDVNAAGVATGALTVARAAQYCPADTSDCYIYVFPAGAVAPAMSGASSASLAAVTAAGAVAAAVLLA